MDSNAVPSKRPLEEPAPAERPAPAKRSRPLDEPDQSSSTTSSASTSSSDPYHTMPAPCDTYIQLRFQLCRFKGVYRVARLPLSFTFAHLYKFLLLIFGWSGMHAHQAEVLTNVELYSSTYRPGEIKKHRSFRIPKEPDVYDEPDAWRKWAMFYAPARLDPAMRVSPRGKSYEDAWMGKSKEPLNMDDPWDRVWAQIQVPCKKDGDVTLGDVWSLKRKHNISKGQCSNREIAIRFEYDLGASWEVHITVDPDKKGEYLWQTERLRNYPIIMTAKGAPPSEDARSYRKDIEPKQKAVSHLLFSHDTFERYLKGEIRSVVRNKELAVYEADEPPASVLEEEQEEDEAYDSEESADGPGIEWDGPRYHLARSLSPYQG
ncbi:hypothetical protein BV20DRAFT_940546 [Pilatotrama ljubarskyi]|nr:hypothetical protein BV20DRAFT_940546 [Pilatotrama ljubarskyi]